MGSPWPASSDPGAFADWMLRHQLRTSTFFAPYGDATVGEVRDALRLRKRVRTFADEHQYETPTRLQREFVRRFVDRGTGLLR